MKKGNRFYVYEWFIIDTNQVFYVGKGTRDRYLNKSNRNTHFKRIIAKYDCDVRIIQDGLTEEESFLLEEEVISNYKKNGIVLANKSNGGKGGSSGTKHPETYKDKFRGDKNPMYGRPWWDENTPESKITEWKKKISEGHKGEKNSQFGKPFHERMDEETYKKWVEAHKIKLSGDKNGRSRKCLMLNPEREVVKEFSCVKYCIDYLIEKGIAPTENTTTIRSSINYAHRQNKMYCGYYFKKI